MPCDGDLRTNYYFYDPYSAPNLTGIFPTLINGMGAHCCTGCPNKKVDKILVNFDLDGFGLPALRKNETEVIAHLHDQTGKLLKL